MSVLLGVPASAAAQAAGAGLSPEQTARFTEQARLWQRQLIDQVMPYWYDSAIDREYGGYLLREAVTPEKLVVTQARLIWGFAHAHLAGLRDPKRDYLAAATYGYRFLHDHFRDPTNGGYFWTTNRVGQVLDDRKFLYGQAFVIYALVEYYRASGDPEALSEAQELYRTVQAHCRDPEHGGWGEHFERDWRPALPEKAGAGVGIAGSSAAGLAARRATQLETGASGGITGSSTEGLAAQLLAARRAIELETRAKAGSTAPGAVGSAVKPLPKVETRIDVGMIGMKSGDAMLHWMEALTELDRTTRAAAGDAAALDLEIDAALAEALDLSMKYFFPAKPAQAYPYRKPDWQRPIGGNFKTISYGHNVEFAWQMLDAERVLGRPPSRDRFDAILRHALAHGFDDERGGLYELGFDDRPAVVTDKVWWAQAELLTALTESLSQRPDPDYARALDQLLGFLTEHQIDPRDGIWFDTVAADGSLRRPVKADNWKANYHDLRAMTKFILAFGNGLEGTQAPPR